MILVSTGMNDEQAELHQQTGDTCIGCQKANHEEEADKQERSGESEWKRRRPPERTVD